MRKMFLLVFLIALPLAAQEQAPPEIVLHQVLNLDSGQVSAIQQLATARQTAIEGLLPQIQKAQQALGTALGADSPDPAEIGKLMINLRDLQHQVEQKQQQFREGFTALLNDAQRAQVDQIRGVETALRAAQALHQLGF